MVVDVVVVLDPNAFGIMAPRISSWPAWSNISSTDTGIRSADDWIEAHRKEDGADGLWRIHDGLYDLGQWIHTHPGGPQWLDITRVSLQAKPVHSAFKAAGAIHFLFGETRLYYIIIIVTFERTCVCFTTPLSQ